jgi:hypothetical protein
MAAQHPLARWAGGPEERMIRARLAFYVQRKAELMGRGASEADAAKTAGWEARRLRFNRRGEISQG